MVLDLPLRAAAAVLVLVLLSNAGARMILGVLVPDIAALSNAGAREIPEAMSEWC